MGHALDQLGAFGGFFNRRGDRRGDRGRGVDDAFLGQAGQAGSIGGQGAQSGRLRAQGHAFDQDVAAQQRLEVVAQGVQIGAQGLDVRARLLLDPLAGLGLDLQLVLAAGGDLALELQLVDGLEVGHLVVTFGDLLAVLGGEESADQGRPQRGHHGQAQHAGTVAQHEHRRGHEGERQCRY